MSYTEDDIKLKGQAKKTPKHFCLHTESKADFSENLQPEWTSVLETKRSDWTNGQTAERSMFL